MSGTLYVVGGPIGNLEDVTLRALRVLNSVDKIAAEDTRHTLKLLNHYGLKTPVVSYHAHSGEKKEKELLEFLLGGGGLALVSDAGMPGVSDPGSGLIRLCARAGVKIVPIPGPTAVATAVSMAAIGNGEYSFIGFLPSKGTERRRRLKQLANETRALVFYEAPHRIIETLKDMEMILGSRPCALFREMTKIYEEILRGGIAEIRAELNARETVKGEITLVVQGAGERPERELSVDLDTAAARLIAASGEPKLSDKDMKNLLAAIFDCPRNRADRALKAALANFSRAE